MAGLASVAMDFLLGGGAGTIAGLAGKWIDGKNRLKELEMSQAHELNLSQKEIELAKMQLESKEILATKEQTFTLDKLDLENLAASFEHDRATYSKPSENKWLLFVDVYRGITRPTLTNFLLFYLAGLVIYTLTVYGAAFEPSAMQEMTRDIIKALITAALLALGWWFGSRKVK